MPATDPLRKKQIFVSYARDDRRWLTRLEDYLKALANEGETDCWIDTDRLRPGAVWREELRGAIDAADCAVLLVSARYFSSTFIRDHELPAILKAAERGCRLLVIKVGGWDLEKTPLGRIQLVEARPLEDMSKRDCERAFHDLVQQIREIAALPRYDVFVAVPMIAAGARRNSVRAVATEIVRALEICGMTTYCAELSLREPGGADIPQNAVETLDILRRSRNFVMYYPFKTASSVLFEAGFAIALDKPSVYFVRRAKDLPYMLGIANSAMNSVHVHTFSRTEPVTVTIARNCESLFKVYGSRT
jgi:TIR domain